MRKLGLLPTMVVVGALAAASPLPSRRVAYPIVAEQVAHAIAARGVEISPAQVEFLAVVVSAVPGARLDAVALEPWGERRSKVLVACHEHGQCLPFYVAVNWTLPNDAQAGSEQWAQSQRLIESKTTARRKPDIRIGQPAMLLIDKGRIHMQVPVICLENGVIGRNIRVSSKDRKQIFVAEVLNGNTVKGGIE